MNRREIILFLSLQLFSGAAWAAEYTTFIGDANPYQVARVVADTAGNTYIAGTRVLNQSSDIFIMKLDPAGNILFFRDISGKGSDSAADMAIDAAGNIYVGGSTTSYAFPVRNALQSTPGPGFLLKLSADASGLIWSTYFREAIAALAVDSSGNVYVTGTTGHSDFPVTPGLPAGQLGAIPPIDGAFLTKISAMGNSIVYSAVISGGAKNCGGDKNCAVSPRTTSGVSVAVDAAGNAYLAGNTDTNNLPTTPGAFLASGVGAFVAKVKPDGSSLAYLTYIGATQYPLSPNANPANTASAIACDAAGNAYLTGTTFDPQFPATQGAFQTTFHGPATQTLPLPTVDAFALKLNPAGNAVAWGTYLGGSADDVPNALAVDASGQIWLAGTTASPEFPNAQGWFSMGSDFISGLNASGSALIYSARYPNDGASRSISVDAAGLLHIAGPSGIVSTVTPGMPPLPRVWGVANAANGPLDGRVAPGEVISLYGPHIGPSSPIAAVPDGNGNYPTSVSGYQVLSGAGGPIPLLYLSDSQINAVIPFGNLAGPIQVITPNGATPNLLTTSVPAHPEIFHNLDGSALALNQDGTLNAAGNPAHSGSTVRIWITGSPVVNPDYYAANGNKAGQAATTAINFVSDYCCGVELGNQNTPTVTFAGTALGLVWGISELDFQIPSLPGISTFGTGLPLLTMANDGSKSRPVTLYVIN